MSRPYTCQDCQSPAHQEVCSQCLAVRADADHDRLVAATEALLLDEDISIFVGGPDGRWTKLS